MANKRASLDRAEFERLLDGLTPLYKVKGGSTVAREIIELLYDLLDASEREAMENELRTAFAMMELEEKTGVRLDG